MPKAKLNSRNLIKRFPLAILIGILALAFSIFSLFEISRTLHQTDVSNTCSANVINQPQAKGSITPCLYSGYSPPPIASRKPMTHEEKLRFAGWIAGAVGGGVIILGDWVYVSRKLDKKAAKKSRRK